jgi:hypothetical protein
MKYLLILLLLLSSCAVKKAASTIEGAEKNIKNANQTIINQLERYPFLSTSSTTTDSIFIPGDSILIVDTIQNNEALQDLFVAMASNQLDLIDVENTLEVVTELKDKEIKQIKRVLKNYRHTSDSLFSLYRETATLLNQVGTIEKDGVVVKYKIVNGVLSIKSKVKDRLVGITNTTTNDIKIKDSFWQDEKFYYLMFGLLVLIYFIGDILKNILQRVVNTIVDLFKRLFKII